MKTQITRRAAKDYYANVIEIGYCDAQHLLYFCEPAHYTAGIYGWNSDIYTFDGNSGIPGDYTPAYACAISTGYRPFGNVHPSYQLVDKFDREARDVINNRDITLADKRAMVSNILNEFIGACLGVVPC